jgi:hypothetical protein
MIPAFQDCFQCRKKLEYKLSGRSGQTDVLSLVPGTLCLVLGVSGGIPLIDGTKNKGQRTKLSFYP